MGPEDTPLEIGLKFAVKFSKPKEFLGKKALLQQQAEGCRNHQFMCEVMADSALILHDEPIYSNGTIVGHCTSGGIGFRTVKILCLVIVHNDQILSREVVMNGQYEIEIAGERLALKVLSKPPYSSNE